MLPGRIKLIFVFCLLMISAAAYSQVDDQNDDGARTKHLTDFQIDLQQDPFHDINVDDAVQKQLELFKAQLKDYVKKESNISLMNQGLPSFLVDYGNYLKKYYTAIKSIDPTVSIKELPEVDRILKEEFGWSTYDMMKEYQALIYRLQTEIVPYIEAEAYEKAWGFDTEQRDPTNTQVQAPSPLQNGNAQEESGQDNTFRYEYMMKKLTEVETELDEYKKKWDTYQNKAAKNIEWYSKKVRSYTYSNDAWVDNGEGFVPIKQEKEISNTYSLKEYALQNPTQDELVTGAKFVREFFKNAYLVDDLNGIFLHEREIAAAEDYKENIFKSNLNIKVFKKLLTAYKDKHPIFQNKELKKKMEVHNWDRYFMNNFQKIEAESRGELALQKQKMEVNDLTFKRFSTEFIGGSINILLAAAAKDVIFTALDQSSKTDWLVPDHNNPEKADGNYYKLNNYVKRQKDTYISLETYAGLLTFVLTGQTVNYGGNYFLKGWQANWDKLLTTKGAAKVSSFLQQNADAFVAKVSKTSFAEKFKASSLSSKMNQLFESTMYKETTDLSGAFIKKGFSLVKGFGFFSIGFALGDRFSKYVVSSIKFHNELSLPDDDPIKIKTQELIAEMNSSKGAKAETANSALSLFLSNVLFTKAAVLPKYYTIMKQLNEKHCKVTYKILKELLAEQLAKQKPKSWIVQAVDPRNATVIFSLQAYIDELVVSKMFFADLKTEHRTKMDTIYREVASETTDRFMQAILQSGDLNYIENELYSEYGKYVALSGVVKELRARPKDMKCCLKHLKSNHENKQLMAGACIQGLILNIIDPEKHHYICDNIKDAAEINANTKIKYTIKEYPEITAEQKKIIENGKEYYAIMTKPALENLKITDLIEEDNFNDAKAWLSFTIGDDMPTVLQLSSIMDDANSCFKGNLKKAELIECGLNKLEELFAETYPRVILNGPLSRLQLKKDVLAATATNVYVKLKALSTDYKKDGLTGEDYLQARLYYVLQNRIIYLKDGYPPYIGDIYTVMTRLGLSGINTNKYGVTDIEVPEKIKNAEQVPTQDK